MRATLNSESSSDGEGGSDGLVLWEVWMMAMLCARSCSLRDLRSNRFRSHHVTHGEIFSRLFVHARPMKRNTFSEKVIMSGITHIERRIILVDSCGAGAGDT